MSAPLFGSLRKRASTAALRENQYSRKLHKDNKVALEIFTKEEKPNYVRKEVRQRVRRYCCRCDKETGRSGTDEKAGAYETESADICSSCDHRSCQDCLHEHIARRSKSKRHRDTTTDHGPQEPAGWLLQHDAFLRSLARNGEEAKSIQLLLEAEFSALQGHVDESWIRWKMS